MRQVSGFKEGTGADFAAGYWNHRIACARASRVVTTVVTSFAAVTRAKGLIDGRYRSLTGRLLHIKI